MRIEDTIINIIFDAAKGNVSVSSREAVVGKALGELPTPTRAGFAFEGWYLGDELVTTSTVITSQEDLCLVARWVKSAGAKKVTMYKKQRFAVVVLSIVTVLLIATLFAVKYFTAIYGLQDIYYGDDGTKYTEKYYVKKSDGIYALFDKEGNKMTVNEDGYHVAKSGNLYTIDPETGDYSLYAMVDYDSAGGEVLGFSDRIMMFPQIKQANTDFITVTNEHGTYKFYRDPDDGYVKIAGSENAVVNYDAELYASLCVSAGYMLTMQKLDFSSDAAPRLEDGTIDYSAYGLVDRYEDGKLVYSPASYTIGGKHLKDTDGDGVIGTDEYVYAEYTVLVGEPLLSDGGYYVQLEKGVLTANDYYREIPKRDAVYIVSADIKDSLLQPIESLVTPMIVYPTTMTQYLMAQDFILGTAAFKETDGRWKLSMEEEDVIAAFTFTDLESRVNTIFSARPYIPQSSLLQGYNINDNNATGVLGNMYQMEFVGCKKLGIYKLDEKGDPIKVKIGDNERYMLDVSILAEYGLDKDFYYMSYATPEINANGQSVTNEKGEQMFVQNDLLISQKTPQGTYYVASYLCNMIVEVDQYYLSFLEWDKSDWYDPYFFSYNMAHVTDLEFIYGDQKYNFTFDNTYSYAYYEKSPGKWAVVDFKKGTFSINKNGSCKYTKDGTTYNVKLVDFSKKDAFSLEKQKVYYTDSDGTKLEITVSAPNLLVYCDQYTGDRGHMLDYVIRREYTTDSGTQKTEAISAVDNFRRFYRKLLYFTLEGDFETDLFEQTSQEYYGGLSVEEYVAQGDAVCDAIIKVRVKDNASVVNQHADKHGNKTWEKDNERELVIRFYNYITGHSLVTVEEVKLFEEDGTPIENPVSDPTNVSYSFYVLTDYIEELAENAEMVLNQELIEEQ